MGSTASPGFPCDFLLIKSKLYVTAAAARTPLQPGGRERTACRSVKNKLNFRGARGARAHSCHLQLPVCPHSGAESDGVSRGFGSHNKTALSGAASRSGRDPSGRSLSGPLTPHLTRLSAQPRSVCRSFPAPAPLRPAVTACCQTLLFLC